jgi:hypothetical protein
LPSRLGEAAALKQRQLLFEAHPDWFEAIHLYGTESRWDRLKKLVEACGLHTRAVTNS